MDAETDLGSVDPAERRARGMKMCELVTGRPAVPPTTRREEMLLDFVYAEVWTRAETTALNMRERRLVTLTTLASTNADEDLARHLYGAIKSGDLSIEALDEWVLQVAAYSGYGFAERADQLLTEQWELFHAEQGKAAPARGNYEPSAEPEDQNERRRLGGVHFTEVALSPATSPGTNPYLLAMTDTIFSKVWSRNHELTRKDRRVISIACAATAGLPVPIQSHAHSSLNSGDVTVEEEREVVLQFAIYGGWPRGSFLLAAIEEQAAKL